MLNCLEAELALKEFACTMLKEDCLKSGFWALLALNRKHFLTDSLRLEDALDAVKISLKEKPLGIFSISWAGDQVLFRFMDRDREFGFSYYSYEGALFKSRVKTPGESIEITNN